ncbi:hypothetical protein Moror_12057 [Moniliophthora roreri MCA 2997]|uniref:Uncharacterized protein n=2 Tax=Moniliophthora roreri TaxID=221103 RepID=V2WSS5_MONRO|nr:hypothetical protein Moror_12057 [Moniliophthora roreri MCA 2997]KAI3602621.1 hypothetical protein WG66_009355 [Moniliophthora roreri]
MPSPSYNPAYAPSNFYRLNLARFFYERSVSSQDFQDAILRNTHRPTNIHQPTPMEYMTLTSVSSNLQLFSVGEPNPKPYHDVGSCDPNYNPAICYSALENVHPDVVQSWAASWFAKERFNLDPASHTDAGLSAPQSQWLNVYDIDSTVTSDALSVPGSSQDTTRTSAQAHAPIDPVTFLGSAPSQRGVEGPPSHGE